MEKLIKEFNFRRWREEKEKNWRSLPLQLPLNPARFQNQEDIVSEKILKILTLGKYRKGSLIKTDFKSNKEYFKGIIKKKVIFKEPIQLLICAFPFKIPNEFYTRRRMPDLAEVASITRLYELTFQIKKIYPPGAKFTILCDGLAYAQIFRIPRKEIKTYKNYLIRIISSMGLKQFIIIKDLFDLVKRDRNFQEELRNSRRLVERWWDKKENYKEKRGRIKKALKGLELKSLGLTPEEFQKLYENFIKQTQPLPQTILMKAIRLAKEYFAFSLTKDNLKLVEKTYSNCLRMTIHPKPKQLGIYMIDRKEKLGPWYGVGVLKTDGSVRVMPEFYVRNSSKYLPVYLKNEEYPFYYLEKSNSPSNIINPDKPS